MKKRYIPYTLSLLLATILTLTSCELKDFDPEEWAVEPELTLSESGIVVSSAQESRQVKVTTNYNEFTATSNQDWCIVSADQQNKNIQLDIKANNLAEQRTAVITVTVKRGNKTLSKDLSIYQVGGKWDVIDGFDFKLRWSYDISESQKAIITDQLKQLVRVDGGKFLMGAQSTDPEKPGYGLYASDDNPVHEVTLSTFYIGKFEVTQSQWLALMDSNPSRFVGANKPVENLTWNEAMDYLAKLSSLTGLNLQLPTQAQWEYAARGGNKSMGYQYAGSDYYDEVAYYVNISEDSPLFTTSVVGTKKANELGLYDMSGNVKEMCSDFTGALTTNPATDPTGPNRGEYHVARGGTFADGKSISVSSTVYRVGIMSWVSQRPSKNDSYCGLRIIMKP